jgi:hypothetical protein
MRPSYSPYQLSTRKRRPHLTTTGAAEFLRSNDKMAALLPTVTRMLALQKDCTALLPAMFETCTVLQLENGQLTVAAPNAALATRLKQQVSKLQEGLLKRGWQVSAIRLKVQMTKILEKVVPPKQLTLPVQAVSALAELDKALDNSPHNAALKAALEAMIKRHRPSGSGPR